MARPPSRRARSVAFLACGWLSVACGANADLVLNPSTEDVSRGGGGAGGTAGSPPAAAGRVDGGSAPVAGSSSSAGGADAGTGAASTGGGVTTSGGGEPSDGGEESDPDGPPCATNADCASQLEKPYCSPERGGCVECLTDGDCASDESCDPEGNCSG